MYWHLLWAAVFEWRYWFYSFLMVSSHCITKYRRTDFDSARICFLHSSTALLCTAKSTYLPHENRIWSVFGSLIALFGTSTAVHYPTAVCSLTSLPVRPPPKVVSQSCLLYKMWLKTCLVQHNFNLQLTVGCSWLNQSQRCCAIRPIKYSAKFSLSSRKTKKQIKWEGHLNPAMNSRLKSFIVSYDKKDHRSCCSCIETGDIWTSHETHWQDKFTLYQSPLFNPLDKQ